MKAATIADEDLIAIATDFRDGILGGPDASGEGMCAAVSWPLASYLRSICNLPCECVESDHTALETDWIEHVWIRLPDGRALDATWDQFCTDEKVKIYLGQPTEFHASPN